MKIINILSLATIAFALEASAVTTATLSLKDGSTLKAELKTEKIACSTIFAKALGLEPTIVKSISFNGKEGEAKVELTNGDKLTASIENPSFKVSSMLGELDIPKATIRSMALTTREGVASGTEAGLVFHCTFDDEASITSPAIGPAGRTGMSTFVEGKIGKACKVPVSGSAGAFALPAGTFNEEGCIEFWAKIDATKEYYADCDPRILFIDSPAGGLTAEFSSNNGEGFGGFCVRCFGISYINGETWGRRYKYSDTLGPDVTGWHHYAFSWSKDTMTTYIDGKPIAMRKYAGNRIDSAKLQTADFSLGIPNDNIRRSVSEPRTPFAIDELKIWNYAKSTFDL